MPFKFNPTTGQLDLVGSSATGAGVTSVNSLVGDVSVGGGNAGGVYSIYSGTNITGGNSVSIAMKGLTPTDGSVIIDDSDPSALGLSVNTSSQIPYIIALG